MPIVNPLPNTIANGQLEDAVPVMANFNWLVSQVNGNACPATIGSGILKGNGTGGTNTAVAGTDYAGITSINTFTQFQSGIAAVADANFPIASQVKASAFNTGTTGGTADAITVTFPVPFTSLTSAPIWWRATAANATTTPTLKRDGLVAKTIVKGSNQALVAGDIPGAGAWMCSQYDATLDKEVLLNPATVTSAINATNATNATNVTGTIASGVTATTQTLGDNSTKVATTAFLVNALSQALLAASGYQKLPNGLILQWGTFTTSAAGYTNWSYPTAFSSGAFIVVGIAISTVANIGVVLNNFAGNTTTAASIAMGNNNNTFLSGQAMLFAVGI